MKHVQVAAFVALAGLALLVGGSLVWYLLQWLVGPGPAAAGISLVVIAAGTAAALDWATEKRK